jgi:hypothetical protein
MHHEYLDEVPVAEVLRMPCYFPCQVKKRAIQCIIISVSLYEYDCHVAGCEYILDGGFVYELYESKN